MKEYKTALITVNDINELGKVLNKDAKQGWYIKDTITNGMQVGNNKFEFIYLLERDTNNIMVNITGEVKEEYYNQSKPI